ncbi:MAG: hypothetical protein AAFY41_05010, partial [Bacteroidota bacterium]
MDRFHQITRLSSMIQKLCLALIVLLSISCSEDELSPSESFFKIYDDSNFDVSYKPIDVAEVVDGYIILTATDQPNSNFDGIRLIKV